MNYNDLDPLCTRLVWLFNQMGLKTTSSCQGHKLGQPFYIMFDQSVTDQTIERLLEYLANNNNKRIYGLFYKWARYSEKKGKIISSWLYQIENVDTEMKSYCIGYDTNLMESIIAGFISSHPFYNNMGGDIMDDDTIGSR